MHVVHNIWGWGTDRAKNSYCQLIPNRGEIATDSGQGIIFHRHWIFYMCKPVADSTSVLLFYPKAQTQICGLSLCLYVADFMDDWFMQKHRHRFVDCRCVSVWLISWMIALSISTDTDLWIVALSLCGWFHLWLLMNLVIISMVKVGESKTLLLVFRQVPSDDLGAATYSLWCDQLHVSAVWLLSLHCEFSGGFFCFVSFLLLNFELTDFSWSYIQCCSLPLI